jgi:hypothetical protein
MKIQIKLAGTPNTHKKSTRVNRPVVIVGAFDSAKGRGTAAFNGFAKASSAVKRRLQTLQMQVGQSGACGVPYTVGHCAEFRAANNLIRSGSRLNNIFWTPAYNVTKGPGGRLKIQGRRAYCGICQSTFGLKN